MSRFIEDLQVRLPREFDSKSYQEKLTEIKNRHGARRQEHFVRLKKQVEGIY